LGCHLLGFVDQEDRTHQGRVDVGDPPLAQRLEPAPAVVGLELDAEQIPHLAVEVGDVALGMSEGADRDLAERFEPLGQDAEHHALAGPGVAGNKREAAFANQSLLDTPAEALDLGHGAQRFGGQVR
jgi:hypothetical protein